jgi:hypothetical protein
MGDQEVHAAPLEETEGRKVSDVRPLDCETEEALWFRIVETDIHPVNCAACRECS